MNRTKTGALATIAMALIATGCGGDDDNGALSYEETGTEISAICDSIQELGDDLNGDPANDAPILEEVVPEFSAAIDEVEELDVNEELESARDAFVENAREQVAAIEVAIVEAQTGSRKAYRAALEQGQTLDAESNEFANDLGAEGCID